MYQSLRNTITKFKFSVPALISKERERMVKKENEEKKIYTENRKDVNEVEDLCLVCNGKYSESKEDWIKCLQCANWIHESCADLQCICYTCI